MSNSINQVKDLISTVPGFQYSINLKYDLLNEDKIKNYIPTLRALDIIEDILLSLNESSTERARLFIGSYGKGKSHLVLIIIALLYYKDETLFANLLNVMRDNNKDLFELTKKNINNKEKMLPVVLPNNSLNLNQSFLIGIRNALKFAELNGIMPNTYFNAAYDMIEYWKTDYISTYNQFCSMLDTPIDEFIRELNSYNQEYYDKFTNLYPLLTSGGEFNPLMGLDLVELYSDVVEKIKPYGYSGIFIIYDEFSKYLEGSINRNSAMEIKLLQDFAEKCNRSAAKSMHIMVISHKSISNYVDKLPKEKVDAWKAVADRFKTIEINNLNNQTYEIMSRVIIKKRPEWDSFINENRENFNELFLNTKKSGVFSDINERVEEDVVYGCYPLHPISTFVLPRVSEKVAQNERTIFTFLSTNKLNTLGYFLLHTKDSFPLLTPEYIYDYFESLFKKENYNSDIYRVWRETANALTKVNQDEILNQKIIKTIGIIYIVGEFYKLPPTLEMLCNIFKSIVPSEEEFYSAIDDLLQRKILYYVKSKGYIKFIEATDIDVQSLITDTIEKRKSTFVTKSILNDNFYDNYIYATGYNDEFEITRYFDFEFIQSTELLEIENWDKRIDGKPSDGVVFAVLVENETELINIKEIIAHLCHERIVFIIPNNNIDFEPLLQQYDAIQFLIRKNEYENQDRLLHEELSVYYEDVKDQIQNYIDSYIKPELRQSKYYYMGAEVKVTRKALLSRLISKICKDIYSETPIITNELVNKNKPTSIAIINRRKVLNGLLKNDIENRLGLIGYGLDVSIMQSLLVVPGILAEKEEKSYLVTNGLEPRFQNVLDIIRRFFISTSHEGRKRIAELYDILSNPVYNIGLKRGVIPVYVAVVLHDLKKYTIILRNNQEVEITGQLLEDINEKPDDYEVFIENWNEDKEQYISELERIFSDFIEEEEKEYNTFEYIVKAIHRWFLELPRYSKECTKIYKGNNTFSDLDIGIVKLRNSQRGTKINARDYLFDKVFNIWGFKEFTLEVIPYIQNARDILDNNESELIDLLANDLKNMFSTQDDNASLYSVMKNWYEGLADFTKNHLFSSGEEKLLHLVHNITNNHVVFVEQLARQVIGLRIEDWADSTITEFITKVEQIKKNVESADEQFKTNDKRKIENSVYKIAYYDDKGSEVVKTFAKAEISERAKLLYNDIFSSIGDYGQAISLDEKRQVLMEILEKIC